MEGFEGANIDQLISIAAKAVANQEEMSKREKKKTSGKEGKDPGHGSQRGRWEDQRPEGGPNRREWRNPLGKKQCTYCKEERHWKNECPNKKKKRKKKE
jgi:hypothetical protein